MIRGSQVNAGIKDQKKKSLRIEKGTSFLTRHCSPPVFGSDGLPAFVLRKGGSLSVFTSHYRMREKDKLVEMGWLLAGEDFWHGAT